MRCSVDKACYTLICSISCAWSIAIASKLAPTGDLQRSVHCGSELARDGGQLDPKPYTPAAFNRSACSTNNRIGSAPLPTSPSD